MCTGELTVAFAAGVQMVTDGFTLEAVHEDPVAPVPERVTVCGLLGSESVSVSVPLRVPAAVGVKVTFTVQLTPAPRLVPQVLVCEKSPLAALEVKLTGLAVSLVTVTAWGALLLPTFCAANDRLLGETASAGCAAVTLMLMVCLKVLVPSEACTVSRRVPAA